MAKFAAQRQPGVFALLALINKSQRKSRSYKDHSVLRKRLAAGKLMVT